jgi:hypothetical protein
MLACSLNISGFERDRGSQVIQKTEINKQIDSKRVMAMISTGMGTYHGNYIAREGKNPKNRDNDSLLYRIRNYACVHLLCGGSENKTPEPMT